MQRVPTMPGAARTLALALLGAGAVPAGGGPFLPDIPVVSREYTVFAGNLRADAASREQTYFAGGFRSEAWTRESTYFAGTSRVEAWGREATVEIGPDFCLADLADPPELLDLADIVAFIEAFTAGSFRADVAEPGGLFDLSDINAFVSAFLAGCP